MIVDSNRKPSQFQNKYFTPLFMDSAIEELFDRDIEILYRSSPVSSSVFLYCDDLSEDDFLNVYDYMNITPKIDKIPVLKESDFHGIMVYDDRFWDFVAKIANMNSKLFKVVEG